MLIDDIVQKRLATLVRARVEALIAERDAYAADAQAQVDAFVQQAEAQIAHYNAGIEELQRLIAPMEESPAEGAADQ